MSAESVLIAGCGYVGLALCRHLREQGREVWGLRRDPAAGPLIAETGAHALTADLLRPETLASLPEVEAVVCCQAPRRGRDTYRQAYVEGTSHLLGALARRRPSRLLFVSSTRVYGESRGGWVDEATPPGPVDEEGRVLLEAEQLILRSPIPSVVLRLAGIYGPGRDRLRLARPGAPINGADYVNLIHVDDVVRLAAWLLARATPGEVYAGVDDEPIQAGTLYPWLAERAGLPVAVEWPSGHQAASGKRVSNRKVKALGYAFRHPDFRSGFSAVFGR